MHNSHSPLDAINVSFSDYVARHATSAEKHLINGVPDYAFDLDYELRSQLMKIPHFYSICQTITSSYVTQEIQRLNQTGLAVGPNQFPAIYQAGAECAKILGIGIPNIFILNDPGVMNAYTIAADDSSPMIVLFSSMLERMTAGELKAVIAHECGHIHNNHSVLQSVISCVLNGFQGTIGAVLSIANMALMQFWTRASEISADRAAMICSDQVQDELKRERLEALFKQLDTPLKMLEIKRPNPMLRDLTIIDTPGLNDALKNFEGLIRESVMEADFVVYMYNVMYPLSLTEQLFLKAAVLPQKYTTLLLVGNDTDMLENQKNYDRMHKMISERTHRLLPDAEIFMISALDERCRYSEAPTNRSCEELRPVLEEQFDLLRFTLQKEIAEKKETIVTDRILRLTAGMVENLSAELEVMRSGLDMSELETNRMQKQLEWKREECIRKQDALRKEMRSMLQSMQEETTVWMLEFLDRMEQEIPNLRNESVDTLCRYYEFYCMDLIQEALDICLNTHRERICRKIESVASELTAELVYAFGKERKYALTVNLDNRMWTKGDTVGLAANMVSNMGTFGSIVGMLGTIAAGVMRKPEVKARSGEFVNQISGKITGLNHQVVETIRSIYQDMKERSEKMITEYYADELSAVEGAVQQASVLNRMDAEKKERIRGAIDRAAGILADCQRMIQ